MIIEVDNEIKMAEDQISPWKRQKKFIVELADDFIYSKQRNIEKYRSRKTATMNDLSYDGSTFITQKSQLVLLKTKYMD